MVSTITVSLGGLVVGTTMGHGHGHGHGWLHVLPPHVRTVLLLVEDEKSTCTCTCRKKSYISDNLFPTVHCLLNKIIFYSTRQSFLCATNCIAVSVCLMQRIAREQIGVQIFRQRRSRPRCSIILDVCGAAADT